jgi:hypothetical protein
MKSARNLAATSVILIAACAVDAKAEINVTPSIDLLTIESDQVMIGEVIRAKQIDPGDRGGCILILEIKQTRVLKGEPSRPFTMPGCGCDNSLFQVGRRLLLFRTSGHLNAAYDLTDVDKYCLHPALNNHFGAFTSADEIIEVVGRRVELLRSGNKPKGSLSFDIPDTTAAYLKTWAGSATFLLVPADPDRLPEILAALASEEATQRGWAASSLAQYPGKATEEKLRACLTDTAQTFATHYHGGTVTLEYFSPVRSAAYNALRRLGIKVPVPEGYRER